MNVVLVDDSQVWNQLKPLSWTKSVAGIRVGILTISEKWQTYFESKISIKTIDYLQHGYDLTIQNETLYIVSNWLPNDQLVAAIKQLKVDEKLVYNNSVVAFCLSANSSIEACQSIHFNAVASSLNRPWDIFKKNGEELESDFVLLTKGRTSEVIPDSVQVIGERSKVFIEKGAIIECAILNTHAGCIYLGTDSEVMEGSVVRGPFALGEHSALKLATKIYGPTTIGPHCKVGGEVNNSVFFGYSNKAHDGFIGNSVIGEWCNLGADTNCSNLKNNYATVKIHDYNTGKLLDTGLQFCGLIMGDHSKSGINTMFNTGTVVGVGCNIFGGGFPPTFIPDFSWCNEGDISEYKLEKLFETAEKVWERRGLTFDEKAKKMLSHIFDSVKVSG